MWNQTRALECKKSDFDRFFFKKKLVHCWPLFLLFLSLNTNSWHFADDWIQTVSRNQTVWTQRPEYSWQQINFRQWQDSNYRYLVSEATALPLEPLSLFLNILMLDRSHVPLSQTWLLSWPVLPAMSKKRFTSKRPFLACNAINISNGYNAS